MDPQQKSLRGGHKRKVSIEEGFFFVRIKSKNIKRVKGDVGCILGPEDEGRQGKEL